MADTNGSRRACIRLQRDCTREVARDARPQRSRYPLIGDRTGEIHEEQPRFEIVTDAVARTATAKEYVAGKRLYGYVNGDLLYAFDMAAMGHELQPHTHAQLVRQ